MMILRSLLIGLCCIGPLLAQRADEEEPVQVVGGQGYGSGDGPYEDDEDFVGSSGLPPERDFATTPSIQKTTRTTRPPPTTTQQIKKSQSTVITQRPRIEQPAVPSTTTSKRPLGKPPLVVEPSSAWSNQVIVIILIVLIVALLILIVAVLIGKGCNSKKRTYRTESKEASANGLLQKTDY